MNWNSVVLIPEKAVDSTANETGDAALPSGHARFSRQAADHRAASRQLGRPLALPRLVNQGRADAVVSLLARLCSVVLRRWERRIPMYFQTESADCGPTCVEMLLAHFGIDVDRAVLRAQLDGGQAGVSARRLLQVVRGFGVVGRGVRVGAAGLRDLRRGSILFWNFSHFVLLDRVTSTHVHIVDPALGRRRLTLADFGDAFTGVALEFEPPFLEDGRHRVRRSYLAHSPWRFIRHFLVPDRRWIGLAAASLLLIVFNFATPYAVTAVVSSAGSGARPSRLVVYAMIGVSAGLAFGLLQMVRGLALISLQSLADRRVTLGVFGHLLSLPYDYFTRRNPGDLAMRVRTSTAVRQVLTAATLSGIFDGVLVLIYMCVLLVVDLEFALMSVAIALVMVIVLVVFWRRQRYLAADALEKQSLAEGALMELLDGVQTIKACGLEDAVHERWSHSVIEEINYRNRSRRSQLIGSVAGTTIQFVAPLLILELGLARLADGTASLSAVVGFTSLAVGMFAPLSSLVQNALQVAGLGATLSRLTDVLDTAPEARPAEVGQTYATSGLLQVSGVSYTHPGTRVPALQDVEVSFAPRRFTAIVGRSGSGKSTLASIIAGLVIPQAGTVNLDGVPLDRIDRVSLRQSISYISQDSRLFAGTIRENISYAAPGASMDRVIAAARAAQIDDHIAAMPMRYDTLLGPAGLGLSGGQRQRIALARALIRDPELLILDEATSALDSSTEKAIFSDLVANRTLIVIAHRLTVLDAADQIVVLDDGHVVDHGRYAELLGRSEKFRQLVAAGPVG